MLKKVSTNVFHNNVHKICSFHNNHKELHTASQHIVINMLKKIDSLKLQIRLVYYNVNHKRILT